MASGGSSAAAALRLEPSIRNALPSFAPLLVSWLVVADLRV